MSNLLKIPDSVDFINSQFLLVVILILLILTTIRLALSRSLLENIFLMSLFGVLISICYLIMDAPDVAMTEAALGACLSTCVLLNFIKMIDDNNVATNKLVKILPALILCVTLVSILIYMGSDMGQYGSVTGTIHNKVAKYYIDNTQQDIGIPSPVAAILANYRGYDTLGETTVILIAGLGVMLILSNRLNINKENNSKEL